MDAVQFLTGSLTSLVSYLIPFLFVLTIVVFFHELGHFLVARWCGVKVDTFSIGFGRSVAGWVDRKGTQWKIGWLPLGGYVSFHGDSSAASTPDRAALEAAQADDSVDAASLFHNKPLWARAAVVAAGPIANFIVAIVIFAATFMLVGQTIMEPRVDEIRADSAAAEAGFEVGDLITRIDGQEIASFADLQRIVSESAGETLDITVERGGADVTLQATPRIREVTDRFGNTHRIGMLGISHDPQGDARVERYGPVTSLWMGVEQTWYVISRTLEYVFEVIVGAQSADQLGGPLRIAQMSGEVATVSFMALINLAAVLSVSIGLVNLFPIPILDGGHLLYYAIEAVRGKPLSAKAQDFGFRVGLAVVLMLMIFATWNDLMHFNLF